MKSKTLHKSLMLLLLMLLLLFVFFPPSARCQPLTPPDEPAKQRPFIFIKHNASPEDAKNYQITIEKDPQPGEPCLTISWKTNPDGSGPSDPQIYLSHGYFKIVTASQPKVQ